MRSILFIVLFVFVSYFSRAMGNSVELKEYYKYIYKAEYCITTSNYDLAAKYYDSASRKTIIMMGQDAYNAALCGIQNNDNETARRYIEVLILKGIDLSFFQTKPVFSNFFKSIEGTRLIDEYSDLLSGREKKINVELVEQVDDLWKSDQQMHKWLYLNHGDNSYLADMYAVDDSLIIVLKKLLMNHNYLSEDLIGMHLIDGEIAPFPKWAIVLLHHFQAISLRPNLSVDSEMIAIVQCAIAAGAIKPEILVNWMAVLPKGPRLFDRYFILNDTLRRFTYKAEPEESRFHLHDLMYDTCPYALKFLHDYHLDSIPNIERKIIHTFKRRKIAKYVGKGVDGYFILGFPIEDWGDSKSHGGIELIYQTSEVFLN